DTDQGQRDWQIDVDENDRLGNALTQIATEIRRMGFTIQGESSGRLAVSREGRELDLRRGLSEQGVQNGDKLVVTVKTEQIVLPVARRPTSNPALNLKGKIYFMALVGALAGLLCWCAVVWIPDAFTIRQEQQWLLDPAMLVILGALIGGLTV